jgi:hypothetical protein
MFLPVRVSVQVQEGMIFYMDIPEKNARAHCSYNMYLIDLVRKKSLSASYVQLWWNAFFKLITDRKPLDTFYL